MTLSAHSVAAELRRRLPEVGEVRLHKLLYYAQGHHLATFSRPLFREGVSAWDHGPVVGALYHAEHHGGGAEPQEPLDEAALNTVGYVISRYGRLSGRDLINLSHSEAPWREANTHRHAGASTPISLESLQDFFRSAEDDDEHVLDETVLRSFLTGAAERLRQPGAADSVDALRARRQALSG
jgi:uncharacterized phage-associated protein